MAETSTPYIPTDLHPSILKHLPPISLLRFLTVSKSWYSLIKSPNFINLHLNQQHNSNHQNNNNHRSFIVRSFISRSFIFYLFRYGDPVGHRLPSPPDGFGEVVAVSDTFICLWNYEEPNALLLWNPSINRFKKIQFSPNVNKFHYALGLTDDDGGGCKIVRICYPDSFSYDYDIPPLFAQTYSINNPNLPWKEVPLPAVLNDQDVSHISRACIVNGFIHWILFCYYENDNDNDNDNGWTFADFAICILRFDPKKDCFALMKLPTPLEEVVDPCFSLAMVRDSIAVIHTLGLGGEDHVQVWGMEEYGVAKSWKLCYTIKLSIVSNSKFWAEEDGKVFIPTNTDHLVAFNLKSGDDSGVYEGHIIDMTRGRTYSFTQSLLFLDHE